jgi:O-antigen/teichoic acid export membrane protein
VKIERTKNATRNIIFGGILKIYQIIVPFLMRTAMIYWMGIEYLGLNSLFTSILQVLNLVELGIGSAMVFSMYKPIAEDDEKTISALLRLYQIYYRVIGCIIAVVGLIILPFIPSLISGEVPGGLNVYILYLLNLGATVLSYWLFAYKNSLLNAHQRNDVISKVQLFTNTFQYGLQLLVLFILQNYYWYLIVALFTQAMTNILTAVVATKMYPNYRAKGRLEKTVISQINKRIRDLFTSKVGAVILNSVDTIVISAFLGLTMLAVYQNYYYILSSLIALVTIVFNSCTAGIGNSLIKETKEKNVEDLKKFTLIIVWISGFCTVCLLCLYQPIMKLWVGERYELSFIAVIYFCIYYFIYEINQLLNLFKDAGGIWNKDRFRPLVTALANLIMNLIMVQFWGIYGIILSTVLATLLIGMPWLLHNIFSELFDKSDMWPYLRKLFRYVIVTILACILTYIPSSLLQFSDFTTLVTRGILCCIIPNVIFYLAYHKQIEFRQSLQLFDKMTKGKLALEKRLLRY